ncbi:BON domain-containing protein [Pragia fontium]|uniref:BON domain-containing protein n=2 Tax=Pragia fontium TaxID=82985 RepID=A0AAJ4W8V8_9GAMM|nr:BON domain-containing protein [Pragia fontium]AKJ41829.1 transporter [Pragia fontium]SFC36392.1 BON domain-containing protein [Pragia fontium DSM 5563 = ATCC 49100]SUB82047.1 Osmotically-inducible protein Y precursor [Pragia fontium]VEJ54670.1 Osmotically-inducible protein Y precursor [Pragia fontium]GKX62154.1 BON domain-containing protein [Pragia fontium]
MKTFNRYIGASLMALVLVAMLGCAPTPKHEGTGEYFDDTLITTKVKAAIFNEPSLKSSEINVETFKGNVQLSGFVSSRDSIYKAIDVTSKINGVKAIRDDMQIK